VSDIKKEISLKVNEFVRGTLSIEHMGDFSMKMIPPKLTKVGKEIKVKVFAHDKRSLIFTKKDSLMKDSTPIYED